jgi:hypothetical protein
MRQQAKMPVCFAVGRTECRLRVHCGGLGRSPVKVGSWHAGVVFGQVAMDARSPPYLAASYDVGQRPEWVDACPSGLMSQRRGSAETGHSGRPI